MARTAAPPVAEGLFELDPPRLLGGECRRCGALAFPSAPVCPSCQHESVESQPLSTTGTVYSFTIVRAAPPNYQGPVPYALGIVELPEGLRVTSTLTAEQLEDLAVGDPVELELVELGEGDGRVLSFAFRRSTEGGRP